MITAWCVMCALHADQDGMQPRRDLHNNAEAEFVREHRHHHSDVASPSPCVVWGRLRNRFENRPVGQHAGACKTSQLCVAATKQDNVVASIVLCVTRREGEATGEMFIYYLGNLKASHPSKTRMLGKICPDDVGHLYRAPGNIFCLEQYPRHICISLADAMRRQHVAGQVWAKMDEML